MTKLYIGNLSLEVTDDSLQQLFIGKGFQAASSRVIRDREGGRSRGFGFVELDSSDAAAKAIVELNGSTFEGQTLQVNEARPQAVRAGGHSSGGRSDGSGR